MAIAEGATLASKERRRDAFCLAPATLQHAPAGLRLVLPSPNGSTLAFEAARARAAPVVVSASIRDAAAVARWLTERNGDVAVIAAGEHWQDGSSRFAIEDWLGAGAIIAQLPGERLLDVFRDSVSGMELIERGWPDDVALAAQLDADDCVPLLDGAAFTDAR
jgi:2-phosphosulfolactate phosphatase